MKELIFKTKLLTDVVLNQKAATEGNQESLDFIPGNNFLGIAAGTLYPTLSPEENLLVFHSSKVRFGDAHPSKDGNRTLRIPASMYCAKLGEDKRDKEDKKNYEVIIHHAMPEEENEFIRKFQPKQCRKGFYDFSALKESSTPLYEIEVNVEKSFAIKSAYDRNMRRSADSQMYGYESLKRGSHWRFSIFIDDNVDNGLIDKIKESIIGERRIGRSRTAQYGSIKIQPIETQEYRFFDGSNIKNYVLVYADARLIFLDEYGLPTFQPTVEDLGFENGEIDWKNSQVRTFQYAPWNFQRQARDTDRCGIEKGSVFYIKQKEGVTEKLSYNGNDFVGKYQNEGFGKISINPEFLTSIEGGKGESKYFNNQTKDKGKNEEEGKRPEVNCNDPLFLYLKNRHEQEERENIVYQIVNKFVTEHKSDFKSNSFASQWGTIRALATQFKTKKELKKELFEKKEFKNGKECPTAYLTHGVAKEKWDDKGRREKFREEFFDKLTEENCQSALINLSSEMAKIARREII